MDGRVLVVVSACILSIALTSCAGRRSATTGPEFHRPWTYRQLADQAVSVIERQYYGGGGEWRLCVPNVCGRANQDWGADALTYALYLDWRARHDSAAASIMEALVATAHDYLPSEVEWSDVPLWDSVANVREYQVTTDPLALRKAEDAFAFVDSYRATNFARGACPGVDYQIPGGGQNDLKTLETDSNYIKAATLLYEVTHQPSYLEKAVTKYAAVRQVFFNDTASLYTTYVFDDGAHCTALPARYFGSVNGNMIWNGLHLAADTGDGRYFSQAIATGVAVQNHLGDASGIYEDLQAENDVTEPLVEAMDDLAHSPSQTFARTWLLNGANASASDLGASGTYGRFFGGPPPRGVVTAWQANGGLSLQLATADLDPERAPSEKSYWAAARFVADDRRLGHSRVSFGFHGSAITIMGTIGEVCCEAGHAEIALDGVPTFDQTGIWQNKSSSGLSLGHSVLFAWRWPHAGRHAVEVRPGSWNAKEGDAYFHMTGYWLVG